MTPSIGEKVRYVKSQGQTRNHSCHWPSCGRQVPPAMWGCKAHWYALPTALRKKIWATYRPGQEKDFSPSKKYVEVANEVQAWIRENYGFGTGHHDDQRERAPTLDLLDREPAA